MEIDDKLLYELRDRFYDIVIRDDKIHDKIVMSLKHEDEKDEYIRFIMAVGEITKKFSEK